MDVNEGSAFLVSEQDDADLLERLEHVVEHMDDKALEAVATQCTGDLLDPFPQLVFSSVAALDRVSSSVSLSPYFCLLRSRLWTELPKILEFASHLLLCTTISDWGLAIFDSWKVLSRWLPPQG